MVREDLLARDEDGRVADVRKLSLARRWSADYGLASSNQALPMLAARGTDKMLAGLRKYEGAYAITAEAATRPLGATAGPWQPSSTTHDRPQTGLDGMGVTAATGNCP